MSLDTASKGLNSNTEYLMQGLKMTDGLHGLTVCNHTVVDVRNTYPYRSYELLSVQVRFSNKHLACQSSCDCHRLATSHLRCRVKWSLLCNNQRF